MGSTGTSLSVSNLSPTSGRPQLLGPTHLDAATHWLPLPVGLKDSANILHASLKEVLQPARQNFATAKHIIIFARQLALTSRMIMPYGARSTSVRSVLAYSLTVHIRITRSMVVLNGCVPCQSTSMQFEAFVGYFHWTEVVHRHDIYYRLCFCRACSPACVGARRTA